MPERQRGIPLDKLAIIDNHVVVDSLSLTLTAVADPTRRSILHRLVAGPAPVNDLARPFRISQQAISKHLACLERARLIDKRRDGRLSICTLNPAPLQAVAVWAEGYRQFWETRFKHLDALLAELTTQAKKRGRTTR